MTTLGRTGGAGAPDLLKPPSSSSEPTGAGPETPAVPPRGPNPTAAEKPVRRLVLAAVLFGIGAVAFLARLSITTHGDGLSGLGTYDDGVYYAAADALVHGRLPYRDFLFIQPPLIAVVTAPFAALGTALSDPTAFAIARVAFTGLGAANAVLCGWILRRFGWSAVLVGGFGYAVFHPAAVAERSVLLEPLGTFGVLLAVLLLQHAGRRPGFAILAGVAGGVATGAKIWYIVPVAVLLLTAGRSWARYLAGVAIGGCAIYLPFLAAAPQRMVQQVVLDQLGRSGASTPGPALRLIDVLGADAVPGAPAPVAAVLLGVLALAAIAAAFATSGARVFGLLAVATLAVLLLAPSWFVHYAALSAPPLALCAGVGAARLGSILPGRFAGAAVVAALLLGVLWISGPGDLTAVDAATPAGASSAAAVVRGCVTADDPGALIELDVLSRDLRDPACTVWPDVSGWTYDPKDLVRDARGFIIERPLNARWQRDVVAFLESGDATIRIRHATGYTAASKRVIDSGTVLFDDGGFVVHATHRD